MKYAHEKMLNTIIREIQMKTAISYHCPPTGLAKIKEIGNNKCWQGCGANRTTLLLVAIKKSMVALRKSGSFFKRLNIFLYDYCYDSAIQFLGVHPREVKMYLHKEPEQEPSQQFCFSQTKTGQSPSVHYGRTNKQTAVYSQQRGQVHGSGKG
ncbi:hypothetical protein HJG60_010015 [Phyllostomus discolor]|uniref:Uncharacterized protein n=1 Tax=Phyllostomus discolor TaxID=89673 RepID=A0A834AYH3_9CHIR|nr:hypothetical protein HJG60_010015 [Phyllostomus discolor]